MTQRDTAAALRWYETNRDRPPFDPDGMCLKICRTARNIPAMYPSAVTAQNATPAKYRVTKLESIKPGMVMYFDDPRDSNPFGHIVTVAATRNGGKKLGDILTWTNSVVANKLVKVWADYFPTKWGDEFKFAATWLNGVELDLPDEPAPRPSLPRLRDAIEDVKAMIVYHEQKKHTRLVTALKRDLAELEQTLRDFG